MLARINLRTHACMGV